MNRLTVRLVVSHAVVALIGAVATFLIVRQLAPTLFDQSMRQSGMMGRGAGGELRTQFADAVDTALLVGALVGALAAALVGTAAAYQLLRPLADLQRAARGLAAGRYDVPLTRPRELELAELTDDMNTLGRALADTEHRRVRLLGEVAHEMRTPLTVVDGYVEGMIDGVIEPSTDRLGQVADELRRMRRLVDDLSLLSRAEEGRLELHPTPLDLGEVVAAAAERLRAQVEDAGLALAVDCSGGLGLTGDADRLAQVVTNLVGNAVRATPEGGRVSVSCRREAGDAVVSVTDTGEGLSSGDLELVFERFYRVPGARAGSGTGIGLPIAQGIVAAHGGTLTADSAGAGTGATFTVRLPLAR